jgi:hypothetical protein
VLYFVLASTSMLFWPVFLLPFFGRGRTKNYRQQHKHAQFNCF